MEEGAFIILWGGGHSLGSTRGRATGAVQSVSVTGATP